ncbi:MAG: metallophosphoesterase [Oscillospiraceae bacterium]|nr:metallophosphoesterase [Oscillospiraceae bacterium]
MQILVLSDTHGNYRVLRALLRSHPDAALVIHCGDGENEVAQYKREFPEDAGRLLSVRGNCDFSSSVPELLAQPLPYGHKLLAVHGHRHMYGNASDNLAALGKENDADIVLFGHLHARIDRVVYGVHLFNPGSAAMPRDGLPPSFGLIDVFESGLLFSHGEIQPTVYHTQHR